MDFKRRNKKIDDDWKIQAAKDKAKIAREEEAARRLRMGEAEGEEGEAGGGPPAGATSLAPIFEQLGAQAMSGLGQLPDPRTGMRRLDLATAQYAIDLLGSIEAKTRGRLDVDEEQMLKQILTPLRQAYAQVEKQAAAQAGADSTEPHPEAPE